LAKQWDAGVPLKTAASAIGYSGAIAAANIAAKNLAGAAD